MLIGAGREWALTSSDRHKSNMHEYVANSYWSVSGPRMSLGPASGRMPKRRATS